MLARASFVPQPTKEDGIAHRCNDVPHRRATRAHRRSDLRRNRSQTGERPHRTECAHEASARPPAPSAMGRDAGVAATHLRAATILFRSPGVLGACVKPPLAAALQGLSPRPALPAGLATNTGVLRPIAGHCSLPRHRRTPSPRPTAPKMPASAPAAAARARPCGRGRARAQR